MELFRVKTFKGKRLYVVAATLRQVTEAVEKDSGLPPDKVTRIKPRVIVVWPKP